MQPVAPVEDVPSDAEIRRVLGALLHRHPDSDGVELAYRALHNLGELGWGHALIVMVNGRVTRAVWDATTKDADAA